MHLNKHQFLSRNIQTKYFSTFSSFPFSKIDIAKSKSKILKKVLDFQENEENFISIINYNLLFKIKRNQKEKKKEKNILNNNNFEQTLSDSTTKSNNDNKNEIKSLNKKEKNSFSSYNSNLIKTKENFPLINRNQRKIKTISLFKDTKKKVKFNDLLLENPNSKIAELNNATLKNFHSSMNKNKIPYNLSDLNNDEIDNYKIDSKLLKTQSLKDINLNFNNNMEKNSPKKVIFNSNYYFSFQGNNEENNKNQIINLKRPLKKSKSTYNSTNIKFPKSISNYSDLLNINNNHQKKLSLKNVSYTTLNNFKSLSILKSKEIKKDSFKSISNSSNTNFFLTSKMNNNDNNSSFYSPSKNSSFIEEKIEVKSTTENKSKSINDLKLDISTKNKKKLLKLKIKSKIEELEKELNKNMKENDKNNKANKIYIKFMIKKCKYILKIIDLKMDYDITTIEKEFDKNEVNKNLEKKPTDLELIIKNFYNNKKKDSNDLKYKNIIKNRHKIYNLIDNNIQMEKRVNDYLSKLLKKNK